MLIAETIRANPMRRVKKRERCMNSRGKTSCSGANRWGSGVPRTEYKLITPLPSVTSDTNITNMDLGFITTLSSKS
jgi:hypothetical protein